MINTNENLSRVCRDFALPPWCGGLPHSKPQTPCIVVALLKEKNIRMYVCMCIFEYMYKRKDINESLYS